MRLTRTDEFRKDAVRIALTLKERMRNDELLWLSPSLWLVNVWVGQW
jgi:hypothetical protein